MALVRLLWARVLALDPNTLDAQLIAGLFEVGVTMGCEAVGLPTEVESWA
ncbi:MAG TPA: hypothetical protein VFW92_10430 [Candidatus Limnocylindrales bacterium]|nr:hypothetical protein [Candidatus Limnocylindrales bacterium]